jgi:hypothetical protein
VLVLEVANETNGGYLMFDVGTLVRVGEGAVVWRVVRIANAGLEAYVVRNGRDFDEVRVDVNRLTGVSA